MKLGPQNWLPFIWGIRAGLFLGFSAWIWWTVEWVSHSQGNFPASVYAISDSVPFLFVFLFLGALFGVCVGLVAFGTISLFARLKILDSASTIVLGCGKTHD
jgi:hypothetical protein